MLINHRALVVEDDERTAMDLVEILQAIGCAAEIVRSREDALAHLEIQRPCVVLLDLQIPRSRRGLKGESSVGIALLEDIRRKCGGRLRRDVWIPVVIISGHAAEPDDVAELMKLDADDVIQKPYEAEDVSRRVRQALECSGRKAHTACIKDSGENATGGTIEIPGKGEKKRTVVVIGGRTAKLRDGPLCALLRLLIAHAKGGEVPLLDFSGDRRDQSAAYKAVDRLREDLRGVVDNTTTFVANRQGRYALPDDVGIGLVNTQWLVDMGSAPVAELAKALEETRQS